MALTEQSEWKLQYFEAAPVAIVLFRADELLACNAAARQLQKHLNIDPEYLYDLAQDAVKQQNQCGCCQIQKHIQEIVMPVLAEDEESVDAGYYMFYKELDSEQQICSLTLKSCCTVNRSVRLAKQAVINRQITRANEYDRQKISADLHDNISQSLYFARLGIQQLGRDKISLEERQRQTQTIMTQLNDMLVEIKNLALTVRPAVMDQAGLLPALKILATRLKATTGLSILVGGRAETNQLAQPVQDAMYRVAQEALNNAIKHAQPEEIVILLAEHEHFIALQIIDDGCGFDVHQHQTFNSCSLGMRDMHERIKALNGIFKIESVLNEGTTVTVKFPVNAAKGSFENV
ncbi:sensor histidine kinase [Levilactobacillus brevis]|uniref:sensor histidine kinase n=1 Tax=Levilactobacillus brevis TaxID=1580 RepID=UPI000B403D48|nr:sensor histidine kinase [Levilactobacillus brevis]STX18577.1 two-component sensor histidine kinase [Levilactobacillus brevis]